MKRTLLPLTVLAVLASACEMSYFAADIQASEVCVTNMAVAFPGVPPAAEMGEVATSLETSVGKEDLGLQLSEELDVDVAVLSVGLAPRLGVTDLAFINELVVIVSAEESDLPSTRVVEIGAADRMGDGALYAEPEAAVDVSAHIRAGELVMDFELSGELPETEWEANIDLCMSAGAGYVAPL